MTIKRRIANGIITIFITLTVLIVFGMFGACSVGAKSEAKFVNSYNANVGADLANIVDITVKNNDALYPWTAMTDEGRAGWKTIPNGKGNAKSALTLSFTSIESGVLSFDYKLSTEASWDFLQVNYNGIALTEASTVGMSGNVDWTTYAVKITGSPNTQTVVLTYCKDSSGNQGSDTVWAANFSIDNSVYDVTATTSSTTNGTVTGTQQGVAVGDMVTFVAEPLADCTFLGWKNTENELVSNEKVFTFQVFDAVTYVAHFLPNTVADEVTLCYGATEIPLTGDKTIEIDPKNEHDYVIKIPSIANENSVKIIHNGAERSLSGGEYTFKCTTSPMNEVKIVTSRDGHVDAITTLHTTTSVEKYVKSRLGSETTVVSSGTAPQTPSPWVMSSIGDNTFLKSSTAEMSNKTAILEINFQASAVNMIVFEYYVESRRTNLGSITFNGNPIVTNHAGTKNSWQRVSLPTEDGLNNLTITYNKVVALEEGLDSICVALNKLVVATTLPDISVSHKDGVAAEVAVGDVFKDGVGQHLQPVTHEYWANTNRIYIFTLTKLQDGVSYFALVNGKDRINIQDGKFEVRVVDQSLTVEILINENGKGVKITSYLINFSSELQGIADDSLSEVVFQNDEIFTWSLDSEKTATLGKNVYKNGNYDAYAVGNCSSTIKFDVTVIGSQMNLLSFDYIVSTNAGSGYEYLEVMLDNKYLTKKGWGIYGCDISDWRTFCIQVPTGKHTITLTYKVSDNAPPRTEESVYANKAWVANIRLDGYSYPDMDLSLNAGSETTLIESLAKESQLEVISTQNVFYWAQREEVYILSFAQFADKAQIVVFCGEKEYTFEGASVNIPVKELTGDITIGFSVATGYNSDATIYTILTIPVCLTYELAELVTTPTTIDYSSSNPNYITYNSAETQTKGFKVYEIGFDTMPNTVSLNFSYDYNLPMLFSFDCWQDYSSGSGIVKVFVDGKAIKDISKSTVKLWKTHGMMIPSGAHTVTIEYSLKTTSSSFENVIRLGNIHFYDTTVTGSGIATNPYVIAGMSNIVNSGVMGEFVHQFTSNSKADMYLQYADMTITSVTVQNTQVNATISENVIFLQNIPTTGITYLTVTTEQATFNVELNNPGIEGFEDISGCGTSSDPYLINKAEHLKLLSTYNTSYFKMTGDIALSGAWTPIGTIAKPFSGGLDGNNFSISGLNINAGTSDNLGLFGVVKDTVIKNILLQNATIVGRTSVGGLIGNAVLGLGVTVDNCTINARITGGTNVGGILGLGSSNIKISNSTYNGTINGALYVGGILGFGSTTGGTTITDSTVSKASVIYGSKNIGGLSGSGGNFVRCIMYGSVRGVSGSFLIGGLVGAQNATTNFTDTYMAGSVAFEGTHANNYPYWGIVNGYGAWTTVNLNNSGMLLTIKYTSSISVSKIDIFNADKGATQIGETTTENGVTTVCYHIKFGVVTAGLSLLDETLLNGITGNFGGVMVRFTMADGTLKYIDTLDRANAIFVSNFDIDLDSLTTYIDNFGSMTIDRSKGTGTYKTEPSEVTGQPISIFGTINIATANDFEHLHHLVNGGIPTTFGSYFYNGRSIATLSVQLTADIDLTSDRTKDNKTLNRYNGILLNQFYGFGMSEMHPYRGSLYGNGNELTVNMNFPNAYMMGIITISSDQDYQNVVSNLKVNGTIVGKYRVGVVGMHDSYSRNSSIKFDNVTVNATIAATKEVSGLVGVLHNSEVHMNNCHINATIAGASASVIVGGTGNGWGSAKSTVFYSGHNVDTTLLPYAGGGSNILTDATANQSFIFRAVKVHYGLGQDEYNLVETNVSGATSVKINSISANTFTYAIPEQTFTFMGANPTKDFYVFVLKGNLSKTYNGDATFALTSNNYLGTWTFTGGITTSSANASRYTSASNNLVFDGSIRPTILSTTDFSATIMQKEVSIAFEDTDFAYNGQSQDVPVTASGFVGNENANNRLLTIAYESGSKNAGSHKVKVTLNLASNYVLIGNIEQTFVIKQKQLNVTLPNGYATTRAYGDSSPMANFDVDGVSTEKVTVTVTCSEVGNIPGTYASAILATISDSNYTLSFTAVELVITKATPTLTLANMSKNYTGSAITTDHAGVTGASGFTSPTGVVTYKYYSDRACEQEIPAPTEAGTYYVRATIEEDTLYQQTSITVQLVIVAIQVTFDSAPTASSIFVGQLLSESQFSGGKALGVSQTELSGTFSWKEGGIKAGSGTVSYTAVFTPVSENYQATEIRVLVTATQLTVAFNSDNQSAKVNVEYGGSLMVDAFETPNPKAYYTVIWNETSDLINITQDLTVTAIYTAISYNITYDLVNGSAENPSTYTTESSTFTLASPTKSGYTFAGWIGTNLEGSVLTLTIAQGSYGNKAYVANWTVNQYVVQFSHANGTITNEIGFASGGKLNFGTSIVLTADPDAGYVFSVWKINGIEAVSEQSCTLTIGYDKETYLVEAVFRTSTDTVYHVHHYVEKLGTTSGEFDLIQDETKSGTTGTNGTAEAGTFTGFTEKTDNVYQGIISGNGSTVIKLYYSRNSYTLTLDGTGTSYKYQSVVTLSNLAKTGYEFVGWSSSVGSVQGNSYTIPAQDVVVSSTWKLNAPKVSIDAPEEDKVFDGESITLTVSASQDITGEFAYHWFKNNVAIAGATNNVLSLQYVIDSGTYRCDISFSVGDQTSKNSVETIVNIRNADFTGVTATGYNQAYDKTAHSITVSVLGMEGQTIEYSTDKTSWSATNPSFTDVTSTTVYYRVSKTNYNTLEGNANVNIACRIITISYGGQSSTYDGTEPLVANNYTKIGTIFEGDVLDIILQKKQGVTVADYEMGFDLNNNSNYSVRISNSVQAMFKINACDIEVALDDQTSSYNGNEPVLDSTRYTIIQGQLAAADSLGITIKKSSGKIVGDYDISLVYTNKNYNVIFENAKYSITPRLVTVKINNLASTYNGQPINLNDATYSVISDDKIIAGDSISTSYQFVNKKGETISNIKNAGKYTITGNFGSDNYSVTVEAGIYTIEQLSLNMNISNATSSYGEAQAKLEHSEITAVVGDVNIFKLAVTDENGSEVEVSKSNSGKYRITGVVLNNNYVINFHGTGATADSEYAQYEILQLGVEVTGITLENMMNGEIQINADGQSHGIHALNVPKGVEVLYYTDEQKSQPFESITSGSQFVYLKYVTDVNHRIIDTPVIKTVKITILKHAIEIEWSLADRYVYSGVAQGNEISASYVNETGARIVCTVQNGLLSIKQNLLSAEFKNAGEYIVTCQVDAYTTTSETFKKIVLEKAVIDLSSVKFTDETLYYNGQVQTIRIQGVMDEQLVRVRYFYNEEEFAGVKESGVYEIEARFEAQDGSNYQLQGHDGNKIIATLTIDDGLELELDFIAAVERIGEVSIHSFEAIKTAMQKYAALPFKGNVSQDKKTLDNAIVSYNEIVMASNGTMTEAENIVAKLFSGFSLLMSAMVAICLMSKFRLF